jgi:hypothetical protein
MGMVVGDSVGVAGVGTCEGDPVVRVATCEGTGVIGGVSEGAGVVAGVGVGAGVVANACAGVRVVGASSNSISGPGEGDEPRAGGVEEILKDPGTEPCRRRTSSRPKSHDVSERQRGR